MSDETVSIGRKTHAITARELWQIAEHIDELRGMVKLETPRYGTTESWSKREVVSIELAVGKTGFHALVVTEVRY